MSINRWHIARLLLSHHPPSQKNRTFRVPIGRGEELRLCARCVGQTIGAVVALVIPISCSTWPQWYCVLLVSGMSLPAIIDWTTQTLGYRESHNILRVITGALFAAGCILIVRLFISRCFIASLVSLFVLVIQSIIAIVILRRSGSIEDVLRELEEQAALLNRSN